MSAAIIDVLSSLYCGALRMMYVWLCYCRWLVNLFLTQLREQSQYQVCLACLAEYLAHPLFHLPTHSSTNLLICSLTFSLIPVISLVYQSLCLLTQLTHSLFPPTHFPGMHVHSLNRPLTDTCTRSTFRHF